MQSRKLWSLPVRWLTGSATLVLAASSLVFAAREAGVERAAIGTGISITTLGVAITQNFDTIPGTPGPHAESALPDGWGLEENGGGANDDEQFVGGTGSSNSGNVYSFGLAGATDRALGSVGSGTVAPNYIGACFVNNSGVAISSLQIAYRGEQWRAESATTDKLAFQYRVGTLDIVGSGWTAHTPLNFNQIHNTPTGAINGNLAENSTALASTIAVAVNPGSSFCIRWVDENDGGNDDGLAIDDFSITPVGGGGGGVSISVNDVTIVEGDAGTSSAVFTVTRTGSTAAAITFDAFTQNGTASAPDDYSAVNLTGVTIDAGAMSTTISVPIAGDTTAESNETFTLNLGNPSGATISDPQGLGTITNDDRTISISDMSIAEGNAGTSNISFVVSLDGPAPQGGVNFTYTTSDGTATQGSDYVAVSATGSIAAGMTQTIVSVTVNGDTANESNETFLVTLSGITGAFPGDIQATGTINNDDLLVTDINDIQGPGARSPVEGQTVTTQGVVTGISTNGYFIQTPDGQTDGDAASSEGVFVFTGNAGAKPSGPGRLVQVSGTVVEFNNQDFASLTLTEITNSSFVDIGTAAIPSAIVLTDADFSPALVTDEDTKIEPLERVEGMRVTVPASRLVQPSNLSSIYFAVPQSYTGRPLREPGVQVNSYFPPSVPDTAPRFDSNPEVFAVDTNGLVTGTAQTLANGSLVPGFTGVVSYTNRTHTFFPEGPLTPTSLVPPVRDVRAPRASETTVASMNVQQFTAAQIPKIANSIVNFLKAPDVIGLQEVRTAALLQQLATAVNTQLGQPGLYQSAFQVTPNPFEQNLGFLYKTSRVSFAGLTEYPQVQASYGQPLYDRLPLLLRVNANVNGTITPLAILNNHLKSLIQVDDDSVASEGPRNRAKRQEQAQGIAQIVQQLSNENLVLVGDFNAYQVNDALVDVLNAIQGDPAPADQVLVPNPDIVSNNLILPMETLLPPQERYTYIFQGDAQAIDHILVSPNLASSISHFGIVHVNADYPQAFINDTGGTTRYSDHDNPIVYLVLPAPSVITSTVQVTSRGATYNRLTQTFTDVFTIRNSSGATLNGPVQFSMTNVPDGITIVNSTGTFNGSPFFTIPGPIANGASATVTVQYRNPSNVRFLYTPVVYQGAL